MPKFKLVNYSQLKSKPRAGILIDDHVFDLEMSMISTEHEVSFNPNDMNSVMEEWDRVRPAIDFLENKVSIGILDNIKTPLIDVHLHAPIPTPGMFYCAEANYHDHVEEMTGNENNSHKTPFITTHATRGAIIGPKDPIELPTHAKNIDWQAEVGIVIGKKIKNVSPEKAEQAIAGFMIINNLSARDLTKRYDVPFVFDWFSLRCFDSSTPTGPWITPRDAIEDPNNIAIKLWKNKDLQQDASSNNMIFNFNELVAYISSRVTLYPGDIIASGTPGGCGVLKGEQLSTGDTIRIEIKGLGEISSNVI